MNQTMTMNSLVRIALLAAAALLAACGGKPPAPTAPEAKPGMSADRLPTAAPAATPASGVTPDTVLARVGGQPITAADVSDALSVMPAPDRPERTTPAMIRETVESLVDRKLMAAAARRDGLDRDPVMKEMLGKPQDNGGIGDDEMLAGVWMETELGKVTAPTDTEDARQKAMADLRARLREGVDVEIVDAAIASYVAPASP